MTASDSAGAGAVWITRAEPGAAKTAAAVQALGATPFVAPLIATRGLGTPAPMSLDAVRALAFTSATGVRALVGRLSPADLRTMTRLPAFAVGAATAAAATAAGFSDVIDAGGDVADLARVIADSRVDDPGETLLHPCADRVAAPLDDAVPWPLYATGATDAHHSEIVQALTQGVLRVVLVQSPSAARALAGFAKHIAPTRALAALEIHAQSSACAAPVRDLAHVVVAARPTEADLLPEAVAAALASAPSRATDRTLPQGPP